MDPSIKEVDLVKQSSVINGFADGIKCSMVKDGLTSAPEGP